MINYQLATRFLAEAMGWVIDDPGYTNGGIWTGYLSREPRDDDFYEDDYGYTRSHLGLVGERTFRPHERIEDAWVVVEWINAAGNFGRVEITRFNQPEYWYAKVDNNGIGWGASEGQTAPEAIFLAACKLLLTEEQLQECGIGDNDD